MDNGKDCVAEIYNYRPVNDQLITAGQPTETQLAAVAAAGFELVINLALHDDPRYSLPDEPGLVQSLGMEYVHIPIRFDHPGRDELQRFFGVMKQYGDKRMLVHCAANMRVSTFIGLYRVMELGWSRDVAFALMDSIWKPDAVWSAFISAVLEKEPE